MKTTKTIAGLALGLCLVGGAAGCVDDDGKPDESDVKGGPDGKTEAWGPSDSPALFNSNLEYRVTELPRNGQATNVPWAGSYWPVYEDSINKKWAGASSLSPAAKYGQAFGVTGVEDAVSRYHGVDAHAGRTACTTDQQCNAQIGEKCAIRDGQTSGRCIPTWWGICHAWAPVSILLPEPKFPVTYNGVEFKVNDIKALVTLAYDRTQSRFVSLRCNQDDAQNEIIFDKYGRPTGSDCRDTNPGTWHVLVTNYLGKMGESFVYDRTWDDEVWNQPVRGYRITEHTEISAVEANRLIGVEPVGGTTTERTGTVANNTWSHLGSFAVTAGSQLTVAMTGSGDPDLYVRFGSQPTTSAYDCRPYAGDANETCNLTVPAGATQAFVSIRGYGASSSYTVKITSGGQIPTAYQFNDRAVKFFKVHMDVDFIAESPSNLDGNLGSQIDRYTHHDRYDYILEVDGEGKIIGGEWLGASKKDHPDFVWLPIRHGTSSVAGGKITYANVKAIYDLSMIDPNTTPGTGELKVVTDSATLARGAWKHYGPFDVAPGKTLKATLSGGGDADLYVRKGTAPTIAAYDCRPYLDGSNEECSIVGPGQVYVSVNGYATSTSYDLRIEYTEGTGGVTPPPPPPATVAHLDTTGSVAQGEMKRFSLDVIAGQRIVIRTFAPNDVDLYIQFGAEPTTSSYLLRGYTSSGNETISYTPTSSGKLHIGVHGYRASSFTLRTADN